MDMREVWSKALKNTEIIRPRVQPLLSHSATYVPYIFLSESTVNLGDTVVRKGEVVVQRPSLILPPNMPQLEGFEFNAGESIDRDALTNFLYVRGITMPSLRYNNRTYSLDIYEGVLGKAVNHFKDELQMKENVAAGLIVAIRAGAQTVAQRHVTAGNVALRTAGSRRALAGENLEAVARFRGH